MAGGVPALLGSQDPGSDYFPAIRGFAAERLDGMASWRLAVMASKVIRRLRRMRPVGAFEGVAAPRTLWDELCWLWEGQADVVDPCEWPMERRLDTVLAEAIDELPASEAVLISCAASEDQAHMPARDDMELRRVLRELVRSKARARDLSKLEVR